MTPQTILHLAALAAPLAPSTTPAASVPTTTGATHAVLSAATTTTSPAAQASYLPTPFEYSYIDVAYLAIDEGNGAPDRDGFAFRGSFDVTDNIRLLASVGQATANTDAGEDRVNDYSLGFGLHGSYNDWLDLVGDFEWTRREFRGVVDGRHKGWLAGIGVRALPVRELELDGRVLFRNSAENDVGAQLGLVWHWHEYVGLRLAGLTIGDERQYWAGLRFSL